MVSCGRDGRESDSAAETSPIDSLRALIIDYPDSALLQENLVQYWRDEGNYDSALTAARISLLRDSSNSRWWFIVSTLLAESGDTAASIKTLETSLGIRPDRMNLILLGSLLANTRDERALLLADRMMEPSLDTRKEGYFIAGTYWLNEGDNEKAIGLFDSCLAESYTFMEAYTAKSKALYGLRRFEEAVAVMQKAVTVKNNFAEGYCLLGKSLEAAGKKEEAMSAYESALQYDPAYEECATALKRLQANRK